MKPRSRLYFKFKDAFKLIQTAAGQAELANIGIHPILFEVSGTNLPDHQATGYMIDKKGNVVGSTVRKKRPATVYVPVPMPTTTKITIEFASPEALQDLAISEYK